MVSVRSQADESRGDAPMVIRHELSNSWRIVCWMAVSVSKSTEAVASSMMMIAELRSSDRAIASSWR